MQTEMTRVSLCLLLGALLLSGCASSLGGVFGKTAQPAGTATGVQGVENIAEFIGANPSGSTTAARDPRTGESVELWVEGEYLAGTGEICRRASLVNSVDKSSRYVATCRIKGVWSLLPEILSAPGAAGR